MYKELATLIDDNDFLTEHDKDTRKYLIVAKPDDEYLEEVAEERAASKEGTILETVSLLVTEMKEIRTMLAK
jgi:hypothetical protein